MLYSPTHHVAFQHVHKTGGQSLNRVLNEHIDDLQEIPGLPDAHYTLARVFEVMDSQGIDPTSLRFIATICHPMSHAVSIYHYWRSDRIPEADRSLPHVARTRSLEFIEFLRQVLVLDQFEENLAIDGELPTNVVLLRRESLKSGAEAVLADLLGHPVKVRMPVMNKSSHDDPASYFDSETTEALAHSYRWTFDQGLYEPDFLPPDEKRSPRLVSLVRERFRS